MTRRTPTAEQKQAAEERRERIRKLAKTISALTPEQREQIAARLGIATIEGRRLSPFNACLLVNQRDEVSVVGGFQQWRKAGRQVRKGERGLAIWIPTGKGEEPDDEDAGDEDERQRFILGTVFDITQTEELQEAS